MVSKFPLAGVKPIGACSSQSWKVLTKKNTWVPFWARLAIQLPEADESHVHGLTASHGVAAVLRIAVQSQSAPLLGISSPESTASLSLRSEKTCAYGPLSVLVLPASQGVKSRRVAVLPGVLVDG